MEKNDLMKPRYKQILDYPNSPLTVGAILDGNFFKDHCSKYPAIFKLLEWYDERTIEEMPEFLKNKTSIPIAYIKVIKWIRENENNLWVRIGGLKSDVLFYGFGYEPATQSEYEQYINSPDKNK